MSYISFTSLGSTLGAAKQQAVSPLFSRHTEMQSHTHNDDGRFIDVFANV